MGPCIDQWLKMAYPRPCCTLGTWRNHKARLYITNHSKPEHCFDCHYLWCMLGAPCWLLSAPFYKVCTQLDF